MVTDQIRERSQAEAEAAPATPRELVRRLLLQVLPLDETRRLENHVVLAFLAYAAVKPSIASGLREDATEMRTFLACQLRAAGADGIDPERAAAGLLALIDGLGLQLLSGQYAEEEAVAALDVQLTLLHRRLEASNQGVLGTVLMRNRQRRRCSWAVPRQGVSVLARENSTAAGPYRGWDAACGCRDQWTRSTRGLRRRRAKAGRALAPSAALDRDRVPSGI